MDPLVVLPAPPVAPPPVIAAPPELSVPEVLPVVPLEVAPAEDGPLVAGPAVEDDWLLAPEALRPLPVAEDGAVELGAAGLLEAVDVAAALPVVERRSRELPDFVPRSALPVSAEPEAPRVRADWLIWEATVGPAMPAPPL